MMDTEVMLCMGCMNELDENGVCHYCTYTDDLPCLQSYLTPHTVLNDRYIVGKMLSYNGEGASYICYDMVSKTKAVLREYMPDTLCEREMKSKNIVINADCLVKYKTYMSEFQDMNRTLTRMRNLGSICTAKDMFNENNTCYVILEYVEGVSLKKFLQSNRGYLQWSQVKKLFMPLFTTLSILHNAGIIHRGISPENIIVTTEGKLKLTGFSISSIRTSKTALSPEFYSGYTAPEQYTSLEWQGTWTDVYSIAAVIYRILTGYVPPDAGNRKNNDTMIPACRINAHIPRHVSNVLLHAMAVRGADRIQSINDFVSELFEKAPQPSSHVKGATQTIPVVKAPNPAEQREKARREKERQEQEALKKKKTATTLTVAGFVLLAVLLIVGIITLSEVFSPEADDSTANSYIVTNASDDDESEVLIADSAAVTLALDESAEESPYGTGAIMPNLIGQQIETIKNQLGEEFTIRTKTYYSDDEDSGTITYQSIPEGTEYDPEKKNKLTLKVCMGPSQVAVPEYAGYTKKQYLELLNIRNIKYETVEESSELVEAGYVTRTGIEPGYTINVEEGQTLTVYISTGLPETSSVDSDDEGDGYYSTSSNNEYYYSDDSDDTDTTDTEPDTVTYTYTEE